MPRLDYTATNAQHYGIVALMESTRVRLPLRAVECRFDILDDVVSVEIDQAYHNNQAKALDCLYTFPLPGDAAAYRCEMLVGQRVISARVEERQEARRVAAEAKAEGHRVALVEVERDNLFTLSLSNIQPQEIVVVRFAYFQALDRLDDELSCMIPFCPGIRYIPGRPLLRSSRGKGTEQDTDQVPDASRLSPPRMDEFHPDATSLHIRGTMSHALARYAFVTSPSHNVVMREENGRVGITVPPGGAFPDRDFVLRWKAAPDAGAVYEAWSCAAPRPAEGTVDNLRPADTYAMVRLQAPAVAPSAAAAGQDFYFLVDRSGSMDGTKWQQAGRAFREFLNALGKGDRAWVTFFESTYQDLCEWPLEPRELLADRTVQTLEHLPTLGGTELLPALEHVLGAIDEHSPDRRSVVILITDGQMGNELAVLRLLKKRNSPLPVIALGIDTAVNDAFLRRLARQQRGQCYLRTPSDDIVGLVATLGDRLKAPVLTDIAAAEGWEFPTGALPDLFARDTVTAVLRGPATAKSIALTARDASGETRTFEFELKPSPTEALGQIWARRRIAELQEDAVGASPAERKELSAKMIALAKEFNILCEGAAFIAVDSAHKGDLAKTELYQPSFVPAEWESGAVCQSMAAPCAAPVPASFADTGAIPCPPVLKRAAPMAPPPLVLPAPISSGGLKPTSPSKPSMPVALHARAPIMRAPAPMKPTGVPGGVAGSGGGGTAGTPNDPDPEIISLLCGAEEEFARMSDGAPALSWSDVEPEIKARMIGASLILQNRVDDWVAEVVKHQLLPTPRTMRAIALWLLSDSKLTQRRWKALADLTAALLSMGAPLERRVAVIAFLRTEVLAGEADIDKAVEALLVD
ncbi:hypothetical protein DB346_03205 [Verrucomicrobia bacterium LW23]|nr:hypothetical protein DB346_03205 [Verrucomicrobia bacterium LW23]